MAQRDEDSILDKKYEKQIFWACYYEGFKLTALNTELKKLGVSKEFCKI